MGRIRDLFYYLFWSVLYAFISDAALILIGGVFFPETLDTDLLIILSAVAGFSISHLFILNLEIEERDRAKNISKRIAQEEARLKDKQEAEQKRLDEQYRSQQKHLNEKQIENEEKLKLMEVGLAKREKDLENRFMQAQAGIERIKTDALEAVPWLSDMYADFIYSVDISHANYLARKKNPATKSADIVRKVSAEKRAAVKELKLLQYQMHVYETVAPWLEDFKDVNTETIQACIGASEDESAQTEYDSMKRWLSKEEYDRLPSAQKYQLALDRYKQSAKSRWEVGRDFERYVGYLYEIGGARVEFIGANKGLEDMGRDLVVHNFNNGVEQIAVIQCKYWNEQRTIHEKHIFQLYGTSILYCIEHGLKDVDKVFITTAPLSDTAKQAADMLDVCIVEIKFQKDYPCIKCNFNSSSGEKIYHLPFDQQYDRVRIDPNKEEYYVWTVAEAEALGFRRAMRWKGTNANKN